MYWKTTLLRIKGHILHLIQMEMLISKNVAKNTRKANAAKNALVESINKTNH